MLKALKNLAQGRDSGALTGKTVTVGHRVVKLEKLLGEGGFATIYRCSDVDTGEVFALKHFVLTWVSSRPQPCQRRGEPNRLPAVSRRSRHLLLPCSLPPRPAGDTLRPPAMWIRRWQ
jgi:hypothetical protein